MSGRVLPPSPGYPGTPLSCHTSMHPHEWDAALHLRSMAGQGHGDRVEEAGVAT